MRDWDFVQCDWDESLADDCRALLRMAVREDLDTAGDITSQALVPENAVGRAGVVARQLGVVAGVPALQLALAEVDPRLSWQAVAADGAAVAPGACIGIVCGPARSLLAVERIALNLLGRLSGIATLTASYVRAIEGTPSAIYDTRKTTPGWRRLEKYAVRCGGGRNHRAGLYAAILIKDNHLAFGAAGAHLDRQDSEGSPRRTPTNFTPAEAVLRAKEFAGASTASRAAEGSLAGAAPSRIIVEVEVDDLAQFDEVLPTAPDIILLDNMTPETMAAAAARRDAVAPQVQLEASGGVTLQTVRAIALSGVDRISVGALTHSAAALDFGLDWMSP